MRQILNSVPDRIANELLAERPYMPAVESELVDQYELSPDTARALIRRVVLQANSANFPAVNHMELIHTEGCNLACSYCFEKDMLGPRRMSASVAREAVDILMEYSGDSSTLYISHFGGEPLVNFKGVQAATEYAIERAAAAGKELRFDMTSNGVLLTEEKVAYLASRNIMVLLSIDGLAETHDQHRVDKRGQGTFDDVMRGMTLLKSRQQWIGVKMTVMPEAASELRTNVLGLYELGVNQFLIGHATGVDWPRECMEMFADQLRDLKSWYLANKNPGLVIDDLDDSDDEEGYFGCQAARNSISITVDGEISPCSKILALNNREILAKMGDVQYGLVHVQNRAEMVGCGKLRSAAKSAGVADEYLGGCFAANYTATGDLYSPSLQDHELAHLKHTACAGCSARRAEG